MSAFLGPIHSLMYNRIITMQQVINAIAELTEAEGWNVDVNAFVIKEFPPIEEAVDLSNIHASLFGMVDGVVRHWTQIFQVPPAVADSISHADVSLPLSLGVGDVGIGQSIVTHVRPYNGAVFVELNPLSTEYISTLISNKISVFHTCVVCVVHSLVCIQYEGRMRIVELAHSSVAGIYGHFP